MPYIQRDSLGIWYEVWGKGEPILLLHGFGGSGASDWRYQIRPFSEKYQVIVPDLRGHGRTDHPETITGPEYFKMATADIASLLSSLDLGPVHVCGFSMGASIASWLYISEPALVRSLIVVSGAARVNRNISPGLFDLWESLAGPDSVDAGWARVLARLHGEEKWRVLLRNYSAAVLARVESDEYVVGSGGGEIECPTLIVQGRGDSISPVLLSEELHAMIPHSELVMLEGDHWVPGLQPDDFNAVVLDFLGRGSSTERGE
jgi:3-oxoadipate enol-lactonase